MIRVICDRCKKELNPNHRVGYIALNFKDSYDGDLLENNKYEHMHFCMECMDAVEKFLEKIPEENVAKPMESVPEQQETVSKQPEDGTEQEESVPKEQKTVERPKRNPIDYGKIMALRNAGWDNAKIADEMGMTKASVATAISTYKKKQLGG